MKKGYVMIAVVLLAAVIFVYPCSANEVIPGIIAGGEFGLVYPCGFSNANTVELDGILGELAWQFAPWHVIDHATGTQPAPNDDDASLSFAAAADANWLYVALRVTDDELQIKEENGGDLWKDDSVEVYLDPNNGKTDTYEAKKGDWDVQITIGAVNIDGDPNAPILAGTGEGATTGTLAAVVQTAKGWDVEAAIPLDSDGKWEIVPEDGLRIGFNIHLNDDDDGADRDHKLIWSANDLDDQSWQNPSRFAELEFVEAFLAVDPSGKLATTWGAIRR